MLLVDAFRLVLDKWVAEYLLHHSFDIFFLIKNYYKNLILKIVKIILNEK